MPNVALLVPITNAYSRDALRGVAAYARSKGHWNLILMPWLAERPLADLAAELERVKADALLLQIQNAAAVAAIRGLGLPAVNLTPSTCARMPTVTSDNAAVGAIVAEHFLHRNLRGFAYLGLSDAPFSRQRWQGFRARLAAAGCRAACAEISLSAPEPSLPEAVSRFAAQLPHPFGLMGCFDLVAHEALRACRRGGLAVPEDVSIVGVDNDALMCDLAETPLSSVALGSERIGHEAARMLDDLLARRRTRRLVTLPPVGVVTRKSSDILAVEDPALAAALKFIHDSADRPLSVADVLAAVPSSRRHLELAFRREVGRTIREEIFRAHLERARDLLIATNLPLATVAAQSGFRGAEHFCQRFRADAGVTPGEYRKQFRLQ